MPLHTSILRALPPLLILASCVQLTQIPLTVSQSLTQPSPPPRPMHATLAAPVISLRPRRPANAADAAGLMARIGRRLLETIGLYHVRDARYAARVGNEWISPRAPFRIQTTPELMQAVRPAFLRRYATGAYRGVVHSCLKEGEVASFITWRATATDALEGAAASTLNGEQPDRLTVRVHCIGGNRLGADASAIDFSTGRPKATSPDRAQDKVIVTSGDGSVSRDAATGSLQIKTQTNGTAISATSILFPNGTIVDISASKGGAGASTPSSPSPTGNAPASGTPKPPENGGHQEGAGTGNAATTMPIVDLFTPLMTLLGLIMSTSAMMW